MTLSLYSLMKKLIAAISLFVYFTATSGIIINSHYCMKKLVSVHLFENQSAKCGLCGMDMHDNSGCCRDEVKVVKLVQDQVKIPVTVFEFSAPLVIINHSNFFAALVLNTEKQLFKVNHSPPLLSEQDTWLQNNVFRI